MTSRDTTLRGRSIEVTRKPAECEVVVPLRPPENLERKCEIRRWRRLTALHASRRDRHPFHSKPDACRETLDTFAWGLDGDREIGLAFSFDHDGAFSLLVSFSAKGESEDEIALAIQDLEAGFESALAAADYGCAFRNEEQKEPPFGWEPTWRTEILPIGVRFDPSGHGTIGSRSPLLPHLQRVASEVLIAEPRKASLVSLDAVLRSLAAAKCAARMTIKICPRVFKAEELRLLTRLRERVWGISEFERTDGLPPVQAHEVTQPIKALLRAFEREGKVVETSAWIEAATPLPEATMKLVAAVLWGTYQFSGRPDQAEHDWRRLLPVGYRLPQWLPSPATLEAMGTPVRPAPSRRALFSGLLLGQTDDGDEIRLSDSARERHVYCCGATGSGKSTMFANMVLQDIADARGLILIDPHGDITTDVLSRVPPKATRRVIAFDLADPDFAPGLNVFNVTAVDPQLAKPLICGELLRIFKEEIFPGVPEAFGPMFESYYRNAIMLLLEAEGSSTPTIVDVPRVFQEDHYRKRLIDSCPNRHVKDFWNKTAQRVTHDEIELRNIAPYITSKFEPFLGSCAIRTIVGQPTTTLDFGALMDEGHAVLISLAKGALGSNEVRVLGLLLLQQIQIACLARARRPREERRSVTLYVDEAQSFIGGALTELLAEARKFGLNLVLATQTMAQLAGGTSRTLTDVLLGNVANLVALRVGVSDAEILAPWLRPGITVDDLVSMADFTAAARVLDGHRPSNPIIVNLPPLPPAGDPSVAKSIVASSRAAYCRLRDEIEAKLNER